MFYLVWHLTLPRYGNRPTAATSKPLQGALTALIAVLPLQFVAYELSLAKGINPDTPRNLAKAVTTD